MWPEKAHLFIQRVPNQLLLGLQVVGKFYLEKFYYQIDYVTVCFQTVPESKYGQQESNVA